MRFPGFSTAANVYGFWDQDDNYHLHDSINRRTEAYRCSNKHEFEVPVKPVCWCGWPDIIQSGLRSVRSEADMTDKIEFA